jgi:hypothetical protein
MANSDVGLLREEADKNVRAAIRVTESPFQSLRLQTKSIS